MSRIIHLLDYLLVVLTMSIVTPVSSSGSFNIAPITKIVETLNNLLQSMQDETLNDKSGYQEQFAWCQKTYDHGKQGQNQYNAIQQELAAKLKVETALNRQLGDELRDLNNELDEAQKAVHEAQSLRDSEHTDYLREQKNNAMMLSVLEKATNGLTNQGTVGTEKTKALLKTVRNMVAESERSGQGQGLVSESQRILLNEFSNENSDENENTNRNQDAIQDVQGIMGVIRELKDTFEKSIQTAQSRERSALEEYDSLIRLKKNSVLQYTTSKDSKDANLAQSEQKISQLKRSLNDAQLVAKNGKEYLASVKKVCSDSSNGWAVRTQSHNDIVSGLQNIIGMLSNNGGEQQTQQLQNLQGYGGGGRSVVQQQGTQETSFVQVSQSSSASPADSDDLSMVMPGEIEQKSSDVSPHSQGGPNINTSMNLVFKQNDNQMNLNKEQQNSDIMHQTSKTEFSSESNTGQQLTQNNFQNLNLNQNQMSNQNSNLNQKKQMSYSAVKRMINDMIQQIQKSADEEDSHKNWCSSEIAKNSAVFDEKSMKLRRLSTKLDNEKESLVELTENLNILGKEKQFLKQEMTLFQELKRRSDAFYMKSSQNHQVAGQILQQAVVILQRFTALIQENEIRNAQQQKQQIDSVSFLALNNNLNANSEDGSNSEEIAKLGNNGIESLQALELKYQQLKEAWNKSNNQNKLDFELLQRENKQLVDTLSQASEYRSNLRLQDNSELDSDNEDINSLKRQTNSVNSYLQKLQSSCGSLLEHYDERNSRRQENLKALYSAKDVVNIDNAADIHDELTSLAGGLVTRSVGTSSATTASSLVSSPASSETGLDSQSLDALSQSLLVSGNNMNGQTTMSPQKSDSNSDSTNMQGQSLLLQQSNQSRGQNQIQKKVQNNKNEKNVKQQHSLSTNMLMDLQNLQQISSNQEESQETSNTGLDMLAAA